SGALRRGALGHGQRGRVDRGLHCGLDSGGPAIIDRGADQPENRDGGKAEKGKDAAAAVVQKSLEQHCGSPRWIIRRADYDGGDLPFRCRHARFSPPSHNGFVTKFGTERACLACQGASPKGGGGGRSGLVAKAAVAYYLTLRGRVALRHSVANARGIPRV